MQKTCLSEWPRASISTRFKEKDDGLVPSLDHQPLQGSGTTRLQCFNRPVSSWSRILKGSGLFLRLTTSLQETRQHKIVAAILPHETSLVPAHWQCSHTPTRLGNKSRAPKQASRWRYRASRFVSSQGPETGASSTNKAWSYNKGCLRHSGTVSSSALNVPLTTRKCRSANRSTYIRFSKMLHVDTRTHKHTYLANQCKLLNTHPYT